MASFFDLSENVDWSGLDDGEVRIVPLFQTEAGPRVRILITRSGSWPLHSHDHPELYFVLRGKVTFLTDTEVSLLPGQALVFEAGERHGARISEGAVTLNVDFS